MFPQLDGSVRFPELEAEIGSFWKEHQIYEKSLAARADAPSFVFYEGPPTANGLPHPGHCLTRAIKDLFPRYRTMRGFRCERKAGWDTHGLPVEVEVCKELGIHSKEEIETYGVEPFIHKCLESVFRYTREWEQLTDRLGFWIHMDEAYVTYHQSYVESVWWALKNLFDRDLLYQGHKIVWWWAQGGTALSAGEVGQGYREVADPSVYVRCPLLDDKGEETRRSLLVWTTTPWTLPSNQFIAVHPDIEYIEVFDPDDPETDAEKKKTLIMAATGIPLLDYLDKKKKLLRDRELPTLLGRTLIGERYVPPFDYYYKDRGDEQGTLTTGVKQHTAWRVVAADFVTTESGTGLVHQAPAFGEVDYDVLVAEQARFADGSGPELINAVGPNGEFTDAVDAKYTGRWVKECDKDLTRELRDRGVLFHQEQYLHDYPFCWRAEEDPLIQYPRESWFIRTTKFRDRMLANNSKINWLPEHIKEGRFGNFLEANVDWALSRERYWGTPLPIWQCDATGYQEAIGNYDQLLAKPGIDGTEVWDDAKAANPDLSEHLKIHKPYIDAVTYDSPKTPGARMRRVPDVIDCWFDSGAMPFAQWGYPHQGRENFQAQFPADFISEALDQTRGWFYSQLAISTLLFSEDDDDSKDSSRGDAKRGDDRPVTEYPHPFRNCIVLGLMLGEDGTKMSKSKRNYREPNEIFDRYGADALRWYFFANQPPWTSIRYSEQSIKDSVPEFLLRLWNVFSFFSIYANIDGFEPEKLLPISSKQPRNAGQLTPAELAGAETYRPSAERGELDRWVLSELHQTAALVTTAMDAYDNYAAAGHVTAFVDALSNWYVRRSRDRFWSGEATTDKRDAHWTLYECLTTTAKLIAPFVPFLAESIWQNLVTGVFGDRALESVHLCDFPVGDEVVIDTALSARMSLVREIVSQGRAARMGASLKVRQPLAKVEVILADTTHQPWLEAHSALIAEELNVKTVEFAAKADQYVDYTVLPDLKRLGPRFGKRLGPLRKALTAADPAALVAASESGGGITLELPDGPVQLEADDVLVRMKAKPGWAAAQGPSTVVVLSTEISDELRLEGCAREWVHAIQSARKDSGCEYTDRIEVGLVTESAELRTAAEQFTEYIGSETLAVRIVFETLDGIEPVEVKLGEHMATIYIRVVPQK